MSDQYIERKIITISRPASLHRYYTIFEDDDENDHVISNQHAWRFGLLDEGSPYTVKNISEFNKRLEVSWMPNVIVMGEKRTCVLISSYTHYLFSYIHYDEGSLESHWIQMCTPEDEVADLFMHNNVEY